MKFQCRVTSVRILFGMFVILLIMFGMGNACKEDITGVVVPTPCITIVVGPAGG